MNSAKFGTFKEDRSNAELWFVFDTQYIFEGVSHLVASIIIGSVQHIRRINENGVKKICRNVFSLQQTLTNITLAREPALDHARQYFELLCLTPEVNLRRSGKGGCVCVCVCVCKGRLFVVYIYYLNYFSHTYHLHFSYLISYNYAFFDTFCTIRSLLEGYFLVLKSSALFFCNDLMDQLIQGRNLFSRHGSKSDWISVLVHESAAHQLVLM